MLVATGFFENKTFIPDKPVSFPQGKRVVVTIEEEKNEYAEISLKELVAQAKVVRSRIESASGLVDVQSLINEGRNR